MRGTLLGGDHKGTALAPSSKLKAVFFSALGVVALSGLVGCEEVEDQHATTDSLASVANPEPLPRDYAAINSNHKILVAVVDNGTDYNHPELIKNVHFKLDKDGQPVGVGYDYVGDDAWPSPYAARTALTNPSADASDKERSSKESDKIRGLLSSHPQLAATLDVNRDIGGETMSSSNHGTHVAGLSTYDNPQIGLLPYRVLPKNRKPEGTDKENTVTVFKRMLMANEQAIKDGARVINMSIGADVPAGGEDSPQLEEIIDAFDKLVIANPNVVFVTAAGNAGTWVDGRSRKALPCGSSSAKNLLCVAALDDNNQAAEFTNIVLGGGQLVFAPGTDIISTSPTKYCTSDTLIFALDVYGIGLTPTPEDIEALAQECGRPGSFVPMSGTSMASPIVAHAAAEILLANPKLNGGEVVRKLKQGGVPGFLGTMGIYKLKFKKPSWYQKLNSPALKMALTQLKNPKDVLSKKSVSDQYWEVSFSATAEELKGNK